MLIAICEKMLKKTNVWTADIRWGSMKIDLHPRWIVMILVWVIPALVGWFLGLVMGGKFLGILLGLFISSLKTLFDYAVLMYEYRTVRDIKNRRF